MSSNQENPISELSFLFTRRRFIEAVEETALKRHFYYGRYIKKKSSCVIHLPLLSKSFLVNIFCYTQVLSNFLKTTKKPRQKNPPPEWGFLKLRVKLRELSECEWYA